MIEKFDVIIVGAGPAGSTAALALARAGLKVVIFERGEQPGTKNMFGGVLYYSENLHKLLPDFWKEAPIERFITRHTITLLTPSSSFSISFNDSEFEHPPYNGITLLRARFDKWYAQKAEEAGAFLIPETTVDDLICDGDKVIGVKVGRSDGVVYADVVIAADGANSLLAKKAGLRKDYSPCDIAVAAKEVLALPTETIDERFGLIDNQGLAHTFIGDCTKGLAGGAFLYTNKSSLSLGLVVKLSSLQERKISILQLLDDFKNNPCIKESLKGTFLKEYSGHLIPESGIHMIPRLYGNGILVVGDAAGFTLSTGFTLQGMNFAIASGFAAAEAIKIAKQSGDFSKQGLACYKALLEESFVLKDLRTFRHIPNLMTNTNIYDLYPSLICGIARRILKANGHPKKKVGSYVTAEIKGNIATWRLVRDALQAGRAIL